MLNGGGKIFSELYGVEVYDQIGHAYDPQKIYYDFMQSGPSDMAMH